MRRFTIFIFLILLFFSCEQAEETRYACESCCCVESDSGLFSSLEECWDACLPEPKPIPEVMVTVFLYENCPIAQYMCGPLRDAYRYFCDTLNQDFVFRGFSPNSFSTNSSIADFIIDYDIPFNISIDYNHNANIPGLYTQNYLPSVTPEIFIEINGELVYKGMIDNSYQELGEWSPPTQNFLSNILTDFINQEEIVYFETDAVGCLINY
jgi:hypothetical protein